jgi:hypothetical protein
MWTPQNKTVEVLTIKEAHEGREKRGNCGKWNTEHRSGYKKLLTDDP